MSDAYKTVTNTIKDLLNTYKTGALSNDMSTPVAVVKHGQYVAGSSDAKPAVFVRPMRMALMRNLAGGLMRDERVKLWISGACSGNTQEAAWEDAECLAANVVNILEHNKSYGNIWSGGCLGTNYPDDNERGDDYVEFTADVGGVTVVHFVLFWSCNIRVQLEDL